MATTSDVLNDPELLETTWDLTPLVDGDEAGGAEKLLDEAVSRSATFADTYVGRLATLSAAELTTAMRELAQISELAHKAGSFASLRFSTDTADPVRGALLQKVDERGTEIDTKLLFFELEWAALDDEHADRLLAEGGDELAFARYFLKSSRRYRPHLLSEPEEKILAEKSLSSAGAWQRLFGELASAIRVELDGEEQSLELGLSRLSSPDRELRRRAAEAVTAGLEPGLRTRAFIFNTLLYEKSVDDRLRGYPHWLAGRNLANQASDESVMALITAVRARFDIPQRWYRLKAQLLGIERIADYDRGAPVLEQEVTFSYGDARDLVLDAYQSFSPTAGEVTRRFFAENWIDAPVRENKRGGAFCSYTVPSVHPYVMLNYTARRRDVLTMAHELGHGLHAALAQPQGIFHQSTPLTLAETASTFGESLVFERLLAEASSDQVRLSLLGSRIDDAIATVFRQMALNRFEHLVHTRRRNDGELSAENFAEAWYESQAELFGDSVEITDSYRSWWSYIPHFINSPGYVYAYAYGQLLALSAYGRYKEVGEAFVPQYLELLSSGGSKSPEELGAIIGIDLADPGFWDAGLRLIDEQLRAAEELAAKLAS
jgi:oligoendopeptidase F